MSKDLNVIKCPKCDRYDFFSVYRENKVIEYRLINTKISVNPVGDKPYKGNWKREQITTTKSLGIRCMACETELKGEELKGISEIIIKKNSVMFVVERKFF